MSSSRIAARVAGRLLRRRLRRLAGVGSTAWAVRVPLVTLALACALAGAHR